MSGWAEAGGRGGYVRRWYLQRKDSAVANTQADGAPDYANLELAHKHCGDHFRLRLNVLPSFPC